MLSRMFPFLVWFKNYNAAKLKADAVAGLTVAMVLIPQSMAYAQLAGLPAYYGLYAAFLPPALAALFGSSSQLATGPVAVVSLMTSTALAPLATAGSEAYIAYAILMALMVGLFQFSLGALRLGVVVNFLSHPVVNGFTNAAAIIIATSQLSKLFGVFVDDAEHHYETIWHTILSAMHYTHLPTLGMAVLAFAIMIGLRRVNPRLPNVLFAVVITTVISAATGFQNDQEAPLRSIKAPQVRAQIEEFNKTLDFVDAKSAERVTASKELDDVKKQKGEQTADALNLKNRIAILNVEIEHANEKAHELRESLRWHKFARAGQGADAAFYLKEDAPPGTPGTVWRIKAGSKKFDTEKLKFMGGGAVIGTIPAELPKFSPPRIDLRIMTALLPMAIIISLLGFMEAISIAKAMAAKTGQRLDPNQELIGQGVSNIIGSAFSSYTVSGSFSRSAVNLQAGAQTGMSSVFSSIVVGVALLLFTPLLYHLPQATLAAIIMMAVVGLINVSGFIHAWQVQRYDGAISIITFVVTLAFAPHLDKGIMAGVLLSIGLYLARNMKPDIARLSLHYDGTFRHAQQFGLEECRHIAVVRFNGSLFFANVSYLETIILDTMSERPELKHILVVCNGVNELDASGEEMLSIIVDRVRGSGRDISFSGFNDYVLQVLQRTHLYEKIGEDHLYRSVNDALRYIHRDAHSGTAEEQCPLRTVLPVDTAARRFAVADAVKKKWLDEHPRPTDAD